jgi:hypothetical protein
MSDRTFFSRAVVLALLGSLVGCSSAAAPQAAAPIDKERDVAIHHEDCDASTPGASTVDVNGDGRPDIVHVMNGSREVCRVVDLNLDGSIDAFIFYSDDGTERRRESDYDRDGRADEIVILQGGVVVRKERETNYDDKIDTWDYYEGGRLARRERDSNGDAVVDQWWQFTDPSNDKCALVARDEDGDGKPDPGSVIDLCAPEDQGPQAAPAPAPAAAPKAPSGPAEGPAAGPEKTNKEAR